MADPICCGRPAVGSDLTEPEREKCPRLSAWPGCRYMEGPGELAEIFGLALGRMRGDAYGAGAGICRGVCRAGGSVLMALLLICRPTTPRPKSPASEPSRVGGGSLRCPRTLR